MKTLFIPSQHKEIKVPILLLLLKCKKKKRHFNNETPFSYNYSTDRIIIILFKIILCAIFHKKY